MYQSWSIFNLRSLDLNCPFHQTFSRLHGWHSNLMTLIEKSLTSHVIRLTPILAKILTSVPYSRWPLLMRKSVCFSFQWYLERAVDFPEHSRRAHQSADPDRSDLHRAEQAHRRLFPAAAWDSGPNLQGLRARPESQASQAGHQMPLHKRHRHQGSRLHWGSGVRQEQPKVLRLDKPHLSKCPSYLKQKCTHLPTPFSGTCSWGNTFSSEC